MEGSKPWFWKWALNYTTFDDDRGGKGRTYHFPGGCCWVVYEHGVYKYILHDEEVDELYFSYLQYQGKVPSRKIALPPPTEAPRLDRYTYFSLFRRVASSSSGTGLKEDVIRLISFARDMHWPARPFHFTAVSSLDLVQVPTHPDQPAEDCEESARRIRPNLMKWLETKVTTEMEDDHFILFSWSHDFHHWVDSLLLEKPHWVERVDNPTSLTPCYGMTMKKSS